MATDNIHRLLDEAFAGIASTPDVQDLKEEMRSNLVARVAELEAAGIPPQDAAHRAIRELGDIHALVEAESIATAPPAVRPSAELLHARYRVRPKPAFVVRVTVAAAIGAAALVFGVVLGSGATAAEPVAALGMAGLLSTAVFWIVADSLQQETTTNHPMPQPRAAGYGLGAGVTVLGLGLTALIVIGAIPVWVAFVPALLVAGAAVLFAFLGATQTNRHKAWVREIQRSQVVANHFDHDPASAARFGIYSAAIWTTALVAFIVLGLTVGWWWALLAFPAALVVMFVTLARMLFPAKR
ncbi:permease prefix domain 1-containing protein [Agromyces larvae]|uniref:Permease prefix domain 1-containing protein n=1 Tax=Agromyces larvae TaxID=2929802 RepID=A0ABY4C098_9MICO|nr:permease prefix domain 1-containing protein [Agromyces larvae]UOE44907.1 permease prefix domain 1-containing protein [Agromyces larvae]